MYRRLDAQRLPQHVAIIMDGNGRWAGKRSLKRFFGHQQGAEAVQYVVETASRIGLPWLTLYAFSLENNLKRPKAEVNFLMRLLKSYLTNNVQRMNDNDVRIQYVGRIEELPEEVRERMQWAADATKHNGGTTLTLALNYGGRSELVDAFRRLAAEVQSKGLRLDQLSEVDIHRYLYTAHMPDPDLLVRTSGEMRISNFLLWQIAYTEIYRDGSAVAGLPGNQSAGGDRGLSAAGAAVWRVGRRYRVRRRAELAGKAGNRQQGTGNRKAGVQRLSPGNREQATGNRQQGRKAHR